MNTRTVLLTHAVLAAGLVSGAAQATLLGRDLNGSPGSFEAYYDDQLDVTWLRDANFFRTQYLADNTVVSQIIAAVPTVAGHALVAGDFFTSTGRMTWWGAMAWADWLSYGGYTDWRLPIMAPANASFVFSNNGTTSGGYGATGTGWGLPSDADGNWSELGWMYYHNLANLGFCTPNNASPGSCASQAGYGVVDGAALDDESLFTNLQSDVYWSGTEYAPNTYLAWGFGTLGGGQDVGGKGSGGYAWAVRPGDVAAVNNGTVPEPQTLALLGLGLAGLAFARRRG